MRRAVLSILCLFLAAWSWGQQQRPVASDGDDWMLNYGLFYDATGNTDWFAWASVDGSTTGSTRHISLRTYNRTTKTWSAEQTVAANPNNDGHGAPATVMDQYGRVHFVFGSHASNLKYYYTTNPRDPTAFTAGSDIVCGCTFSQVVNVGIDIWLLTNNNGLGHQDLYLFKATPQSGGGVNSWTGVTYLTNCGNFACWMGNIIVNGTKMCFPFFYTDDVVVDDVYYGCYDTSNGSFSNIDGSTVITAGSLPISRATAQADFAVYLSPSSSYTGFGGAQIYDGNGVLHIFYGNGLASGGTFTIYETHWTGSVWSAGTNVGAVISSPNPTLYGGAAPTASSDGGFDLYWTQAPNQLADIWKVHWNPSTGFGSVGSFFTATEYGLIGFGAEENMADNSPTSTLVLSEVPNPLYVNPQPINNPLARFWVHTSSGYIYP